MPFPTSVDAIVDAPPVTAATRIFSSQVLGPQRITVGPVWINAKSDQYGAVGDGVTDDTTAIQNALNAAAVAGSTSMVPARVYLPVGTYMISGRLLVPNRVQLVGSGRGGTTIKALGTFPINTELVRLMDLSGSISFANRVEDLSIDCASISGSTGIYSERINEQSGVFRVQVLNFMSYGIRINQPGSGQTPQNWSIDDIEIYGGASTPASAIGLAVTSTVSLPFRKIGRATVIGAVATPFTKAIQLDGVVGGRLCDIHIENATTGILVGSVTQCASIVFENIYGASGGTVATLMTWSSATTSAELTAIGLQNPANQLNDQIDGFLINTAATALGFYALGEGNPKNILHNAAGQPVRIGNDLGSTGATPSLGALQNGNSSQSIVGTDLHGKVTFTTGGAPGAGAQNVAIVNFARTKASAPVVILTQQNTVGSLGSMPWYSSNQTTAAFNISSIFTLAATTTYIIGYVVLGT